MEKKYYAIAKNSSLEDLPTSVNSMIDDGFEPIGAIVSETEFHNGKEPIDVFSQPMVKTIEEGKSAVESFEEYKSKEATD